jgi:hypothetical protein
MPEWPNLSGATAARLGAFIKEKAAAGGRPFAELAPAVEALESDAPVADMRRLAAMPLRAPAAFQRHFDYDFARLISRCIRHDKMNLCPSQRDTVGMSTPLSMQIVARLPKIRH